MRDSGKSKETLEFDKSRTSFKNLSKESQLKNTQFSAPSSKSHGLTKQSISTRDIFLLCGPAALEPYKKFISSDTLNKANDNTLSHPSQDLDSSAELQKQTFADQVRKESEVPIDMSIFCRPLSFDRFFIRCKEKLNFVFINQFKKDKLFTDLLFEICKSETYQQFLERAHFIRPSFKHD